MLAPNLTWTATPTYLTHHRLIQEVAASICHPCVTGLITALQLIDRCWNGLICFEEEERSFSSRQTYPPKVVRQSSLEFSLHNFINQVMLEGDF